LGLAQQVAAYQGRRNVEFRQMNVLHRYFTDAGVPKPSVAVVQHAHRTSEAKMLPYSTIEATGEAIVAEGVATAEQLRAALGSLAEFGADTHSLCGSPRVFQVWTRR
jgi:hypothetical protein